MPEVTANGFEIILVPEVTANGFEKIAPEVITHGFGDDLRHGVLSKKVFKPASECE